MVVVLHCCHSSLYTHQTSFVILYVVGLRVAKLGYIYIYYIREAPFSRSFVCLEKIHPQNSVSSSFFASLYCYFLDLLSLTYSDKIKCLLLSSHPMMKTFSNTFCIGREEEDEDEDPLASRKKKSVDLQYFVWPYRSLFLSFCKF
jgi:hypothetical protein